MSQTPLSACHRCKIWQLLIKNRKKYLCEKMALKKEITDGILVLKITYRIWLWLSISSGQQMFSPDMVFFVIFFPDNYSLSQNLYIFSCAATQYVLLCVSCVSVLGFWYEIHLSLNILNILKYSKREIFHLKNREQTHN